MKQTQREIYTVLADEVNSVVCSFCKFWECCGSICDEAEGECKHPLVDALEKHFGYYGIEPGQDCWGFRPFVSVEDTADIIGIILIEGYESWSYRFSKRQGRIIVYGRKSV